MTRPKLSFKCEHCLHLLARPGQKHGCVREDQTQFASLRSRLFSDTEYLAKEVKKYDHTVQNARARAGAAAWNWLREQLEDWSEQHRPEAHIKFMQGNGTELLLVDGVQIDDRWVYDAEIGHLDEDDERITTFLPVAKILRELIDFVSDTEAEGYVGDLELKAGRLVTTKETER